MAQFRIPAVNMPKLVDEIAKLNKKADKLGCSPIVTDLLRWEESTRVVNRLGDPVEVIDRYAIVEVAGSAPKLNGWSFLGKVEPHEGYNLVKLVPHVNDVDQRFYTTDMSCDHCRMNRRRNEVFIVANDEGTTLQVGRSCLADFLGHSNPEMVAKQAEWLMMLTTTLGAASDRGWGGYSLYDVEDFVACAVAYARHEGGFVTRRMIEEGKAHGPSTAEQAWRIVSGDHDFLKLLAKENFTVTQRDVDKARSALAWIRNEANISGNYMTNLAAACKAEALDYRAAGIVASVIPAWYRHIESTLDAVDEKEATPKVEKANDFVGQIGAALTTDVIVTRINYSEGRFGMTTILNMEDRQGNALVWFASNAPDALDTVGVKATIKGTIKDHSTYNGRKQTILTRCKLLG